MFIKYLLPRIKTTNINIAVPCTLGIDAMAQTFHSSAYNSRQRASRLRVVRLSVRRPLAPTPRDEISLYLVEGF